MAARGDSGRRNLAHELELASEIGRARNQRGRDLARARGQVGLTVLVRVTVTVAVTVTVTVSLTLTLTLTLTLILTSSAPQIAPAVHLDLADLDLRAGDPDLPAVHLDLADLDLRTGDTEEPEAGEPEAEEAGPAARSVRARVAWAVNRVRVRGVKVRASGEG